MNIDERIEKSKQISTVLKEFTSEAVQLRVLEFLLGEQHSAEAHLEKPKKPSTSRSRIPKKRTKSGKQGEEKDDTKSGEAKKKAGRPGPGEMVNRLLEEGFFSQKRGMNDIIIHCQKKLAYTYKTSDLSPTLARALRSGKLQREENSEGQYEYIKK